MSGEPVTQGEFTRLVDYTGERFDRLETMVRDGFGAMNGRTRKLEEAQAVLAERIATIQARGCARAETLHAPGEQQSWWKPSRPLAQGGVGAGIVVGIIELGKAIVSRW